jgi:hypothetical protein
VANLICARKNIPLEFAEILFEGKKVNQVRTFNEMDVVEGKVLSFHMYPLADLVLKQDFLSVSIIEKTTEFVERLPFSTLKRNKKQTPPSSKIFFFPFRKKSSPMIHPMEIRSSPLQKNGGVYLTSFFSFLIFHLFNQILFFGYFTIFSSVLNQQNK